MLESMLHIKINGPAVGTPKMASLVAKAVQNWLDRKNRKKLPKTQGTKGSIATTAEAAVPLNNTIEVADVSVQTDVLEEDAQEEVQHQVEEVSALLDYLTWTAGQ